MRRGFLTDSTANILVDGILSSVEMIVPVDFKIDRPLEINRGVHLFFGVLVGLTGDVHGKLIFTGKEEVFGAVSERMYGMGLEGEMLQSFSAELGNMISGAVTTKAFESG